MAFQLTDSAASKVTVVANEFIDGLMAAASGEYVKVYLYLLRHQQEEIGIEDIAGALNHTEADIRRALAYWEKAGLIRGKEEKTADAYEEIPPVRKEIRPASGSESYSAERLNRLGGDEAFAELLYIAQKYMNKVFTQKECQTFAYLYDELQMRPELLEYLVEYCVQLGHSNIRYIEAVALNWHQKGITTVDSARTSTAAYTRDAFAVMRAFGLTDRKPAQAEKQMIEKWFQDWGFSKELVLEACNRTIAATHSPSFQYADRILSGWKKSGVRSMEDVRILDENYGKRQKETGGGQSGPRSSRQPAGAGPSRRPANQFHNFDQRDVDYDALILEQLRQK